MDQDYLAYLEVNREPPVDIDAGQALAAISNQMKPVIDQKPAQPTVAVKQSVAASPVRVRKKDPCKDDALSCGLAKITATVKNLKHAVLGSDSGREASTWRPLEVSVCICRRSLTPLRNR